MLGPAPGRTPMRPLAAAVAAVMNMDMMLAPPLSTQVSMQLIWHRCCC